MTNQTKVTLPREVAEAIEKLRNSGWPEDILMDRTEFFVGTPDVDIKLEVGIDHSGYAIAKFLTEDYSKNMPIYMSALVNGFEIEKSPEDMVRDYYQNYRELLSKYEKDYDLGVLNGITVTLNLLGITIEGINDKEESE